MHRAIAFLAGLLCAALAGCQSALPPPPDGMRDHKRAIEQVLVSFGRAILEKDRALYMSLFFSDQPGEVGWQHVSEDTRLVHIRQSKPDAIKARRIPGNNFVSLIDEAVGTSQRREERFHNVRIDTDGEIASVFFDYEFLQGETKTNWGKEHWQLVRTEQGWKIFSVVYSVRDPWSTEPGARP